MSKTPDIYEDTCLHAAILADTAVDKAFPNCDPEIRSRLAEDLAFTIKHKYRTDEKFRESLQPCHNDTKGNDSAAAEVRDNLVQKILPQWLPVIWKSAKHPFCVHRFSDAPEHLKAAADQGGDEDWIVEIPPGGLHRGIPLWIEVLDSTREPILLHHPRKLGWKIAVGSH